MSGYRLETFLPAAGPGSRQAPLERRIETAREAAYTEGYLEGQAAATDGFLEEQGRLTTELIEAIDDARLTNEAARRHVAATLAPMVEALAGAIAPALADAGLGAEIAAVVERALVHAPAARPRLRCAPEVAGRLGRMLAEMGFDACVEEAPELLPREAQIFWDQGYDHLDLDACIAHVRDCIASHLRTNAGEDHDRRQRG